MGLVLGVFVGHYGRASGHVGVQWGTYVACDLSLRGTRKCCRSVLWPPVGSLGATLGLLLAHSKGAVGTFSQEFGGDFGVVSRDMTSC